VQRPRPATHITVLDELPSRFGVYVDLDDLEAIGANDLEGIIHGVASPEV